ncbi:MAG TPA: malto-oligosyltrehalose trehalohydrolase [Vicinamibacteria bacterium]|nr:malto-oligosyltrehalose trehalohydrolase [Vicinamibacteria bacterium]
MSRRRLGATPVDGERCHFSVWAPEQARVELFVEGESHPRALERDDLGYHQAVFERVPAGTRYLYRLADGKDRPDPASRFQPEGVHGASEVLDLGFEWTDRGWVGYPTSSCVLYELHVGTFTTDGTFDAVVGHLDRLRELGITVVEIMPVAQFPGSRNWGYDGVFPFAVQASYGGPRGLQRLVDACHRRGLAVVLDVVYNHLGPEGNILGDYGPYFTDVYRTPWGAAINFDGPESEGVRRYFIENALQWIGEFHIDGLRLDAVHAILDRSAKPFLEELAAEVHALGERVGRRVAVIAESDLNDPRLVRSTALGGFGLDSMWCDDLHHATHVLLTGETNGYYEDFGKVEHLARAWERGMTYAGEYSRYRKRRHGRPVTDLERQHIVVSVQNHDQIGNRMFGERLGAIVDFESEKLAAGVLLMSPFVPLIFMGQEYGETAPFQYFVSHGDPELRKAVREGRRDEFRSFDWKGEVPDPQSEEAFRRSVLNHELRVQGRHALVHELYRELLGLRWRLLAIGMDDTICFEARNALLTLRDRRAWMMFHFGQEPIPLMVPLPEGRWVKAFDSAEAKWQGPGSDLPETLDSEGEAELSLPARSFAVYCREKLPDQGEA